MISLEDSEKSIVGLRSEFLSQVGAEHVFTCAPAGDGLDTARITRKLNLRNGLLATSRQVHGSNVVGVTQANATEQPEADALITDDPNITLCIRTADCAPILLASRNGRHVAAVHAGWRGVIANVAIAAIDALAVPPTNLIAAIGPCISVNHFEVGEEVAQAFEQANLKESVNRAPQCKPHINLPHAITLQLQRAGIPSDAIDRSDYCTYRDKDLFFSYRRAKDTRRMLAMITPAR